MAGINPPSTHQRKNGISSNNLQLYDIMTDHTLVYKYNFSFPNGISKDFLIEIDSTTLDLKTDIKSFPAWTQLPKNQCSCCTLNQQEHLYCPIAANLADLVFAFKDTASYESCSVTCWTAERTVHKDTIVQDGLSSIMGIIMATSGCPTMNILKPMARFHLPFSTVDEAMYRSVSTYLIRQYFTYLEKGDSDFRLENVKEYYSKIEIVNSGILKRIHQATKMDADKNAIVILNCLAQILYLEIDDDLHSFKHLFAIPD